MNLIGREFQGSFHKHHPHDLLLFYTTAVVTMQNGFTNKLLTKSILMNKLMKL